MKRALCAALLLLVPATAFADLEDWTEVPEYVPSPEHFALELRVGQYYPQLGQSWNDYFGGDAGPVLAFEFDYFPVRVPILGMIGGGFGLGWCQWEGAGRSDAGMTLSQKVVFEIVPMNFQAVWRFDTLAREINFPLVLTAKAGLDVVHWATGSGGQTDRDSWAIGPRFGGQAALELDFLEPRAARRLDDGWGINHTEVFIEFYGSLAGNVIPSQLGLGGWGWSIGLGFTF